MDEALEKRTAEPANPKFDYVSILFSHLCRGLLISV